MNEKRLSQCMTEPFDKNGADRVRVRCDRNLIPVKMNTPDTSICLCRVNKPSADRECGACIQRPVLLPESSEPQPRQFFAGCRTTANSILACMTLVSPPFGEIKNFRGRKKVAYRIDRTMKTIKWCCRRNWMGYSIGNGGYEGCQYC
jgi:hypothetical protein